MSLTRQIAHNTLFQLVGKIISTGIGIVVIGLLTRYLGPHDYGQYTTVIAYLQIFAIVLDLGLYIVLVKKISEPGADIEKLTNNIFTLRLGSAILFLAAAPLVSLWFPYSDLVRWGILVTTVSYLAISLNQVLSGLFQRFLRMDQVTYGEVLGRIVLLAGTWWVIQQEGSLLWILAVVIVSNAVNFAYVFRAAKRLVPIALAFDWPLWLAVLKESWPIAISVAFNLIYFKADTIILSLFRSQSEVGIYGATYKVLEVMITLPAMFAGLVMPVLTAAYAQRNLDRFRHVQQRAFHFLSLLALPLIVGTMFIAEPLMRFVAGSEFSEAGSILRILIIATGVIFVGSLFGNTVVAVNKQRSMIMAYVIVAIVSLGGYLTIIPRFGNYGAAWMTVISELSITIASFIVVYRQTKQGLEFSGFLRALLAAAVMAGVLWLTHSWHWLAMLTLGVVAYGVAVIAFRAITNADLKEILSLRS